MLNSPTIPPMGKIFGDEWKKYQQYTMKPFTNPGGITKLVNVYVLTCNDGYKTPGFGDYLRGCFGLLQLSLLLKIEFGMDMSAHPISRYLKNSEPIEGVQHDNVIYYKDYNYVTDWDKLNRERVNFNMTFLNNMIDWLNTQQGPVVSIFSNMIPFFMNFRVEGREFVCNRIEPSEEMSTAITTALTNLQLESGNYGVIQIRSGDDHLVNGKSHSPSFILKIREILESYVKPEWKYLLISDSVSLKKYLAKYPNIHMSFKPIEHLGGEGIKHINSDGVRNTLLDFYLMSNSKSILSISVYGHVSGFSQYCSVVYGIPFEYVKIINADEVSTPEIEPSPSTPTSRPSSLPYNARMRIYYK